MTSHSETITDFLLSRIAEDEAAAQSILDRSAPDEWDNPMETGNFWPEEVKFSDRHDPSRVLAECAAKRAIVSEHPLMERDEFWKTHGLPEYCATCADWDNSELGEGPPGVSYPCPTISALAAVYADHPDYLPEWAA